ncbi:MAG: NTP transferase domain-containing protein [Candidatus Methylomirabilales bacterium]
MRAILLAAGCGRRLGRPLPKCLLEVGGRTLLERYLRALDACGVQRLTVVVGFEQDRIRSSPAFGWWSGQLEFRENPDFKRGSLLSMRRGLVDVEEPALVMDADVLYHADLLAWLVRAERPMAFLMDTRSKLEGEEMLLGVRGGRVVEISRSLKEPYDRTGETVGFTKIEREALPVVREVVEELVAEGKLDSDYETALDRALAKVEAVAVDVGDLPWTEIDFEEDVAHAQREILPRLELMGRGIWPCTDEFTDALTNRHVAALVVWAVRRTQVTPNGMTMLAALVGAVSGVAIAFGTKASLIGAAVGLLAYMILDCADGQLARARGGGTPLGWIIDGIGDYVVGVTVHGGLFFYLMQHGELSRSQAVILAVTAGLGLAYRSAVLDGYKLAYLGGVTTQLPAWATAVNRGYKRMQRWCVDRPAKPSEGYLRAIGLGGPTTSMLVLAVSAALTPWYEWAFDIYLAYGVVVANLYMIALRMFGPKADPEGPREPETKAKPLPREKAQS